MKLISHLETELESVLLLLFEVFFINNLINRLWFMAHLTQKSLLSDKPKTRDE